MTGWAEWLLLAVGLAGAVLAVVQMRGGGKRLPWFAGAAHGLVGAAGVGLLLLAAARGGAAAPAGTDGFRLAALWVFGLALLAGLGVAALRWWRGRLFMFPVGLHATLAITGLAVLAARLWAG
jgi:hypothetical protein